MFGPKVETRLCLLHLGSSIQTVGHPLLALHSPSFPKVISRHPLTRWNIERAHIGLIVSYCWLLMGCNQHIRCFTASL